MYGEAKLSPLSFARSLLHYPDGIRCGSFWKDEFRRWFHTTAKLLTQLPPLFGNQAESVLQKVMCQHLNLPEERTTCVSNPHSV